MTSDAQSAQDAQRPAGAIGAQEATASCGAQSAQDAQRPAGAIGAREANVSHDAQEATAAGHTPRSPHTPRLTTGSTKRKPSLARLIFLTVFSLCAAVAIVVTAVAAFIYEQSFLNDEHTQLLNEARTFASALEAEGQDRYIETLSELSFGTIRVTLVDTDGSVLYDNLADATTLPNHAERPEIAQAFAQGTGSSERASDTVGFVSIYEAVRLQSGSVLRLSIDRAGVMAFFGQNIMYVVVVALAILLVAWIASRMLAKRYVKPILEIDPSSGNAETPYEELGPLVTRLNEQQQRLSIQMQSLQDTNDIRRDFTANVTHELKTPIASISGAAELMREGLCKPEDIPDFADRIYNDSQRLANLVNDILTLSKLDESETGVGENTFYQPNEEVDLYAITVEACQRYKEVAERRQVELVVNGDSCLIMGNAHLLDELVGNLVDNALRYNHPGGHVLVHVAPTSPRVLSVSDDGLGIPYDAQDKVFARFYRVDKGRSRSMGGTGLGLAIVKHVALLHDADISLMSNPGRGTTIQVRFAAIS